MSEKLVRDINVLKDELMKIESLIGTAVRLLDDGRVVDLSALEERTRRACTAALALPREQSQPLVPAMEALLTGLDTLTANLHKRFADVPTTLSGLVGSDIAASAYGQTLKHLP